MARWLLQAELSESLVEDEPRTKAIVLLREKVEEHGFTLVEDTTQELSEGPPDLIAVLEGTGAGASDLEQDGALTEVEVKLVQIPDQRPLALAFGQWRGGEAVTGG